MWPRPGFPSLAGAGIFLKTSLFIAYLGADRDITDLFANTGDIAGVKRLADAWEPAHELTLSMARVAKPDRNPIYDVAFNLLYLTTGILYHEAVSLLPVKPQQNPRYATVENRDALFRNCHWTCGLSDHEFGDLKTALTRANDSICQLISASADDQTP